MNEYLKLKKANCKNCHKCIRHCPVKAISFSQGQANIIQDECVLCGACVISCPQNAKGIRCDLDRAKELVRQGGAFASIAPSFLANYPGASVETLRAALMALGFAGAEETALGATLVKARYDDMVRAHERSVLISSCCPSVNALIQKHHPEALPYLAKAVSPMQAHCLAIKAERPDAKTIFIGPCVAKKEEAELAASAVDCALTFDELNEWFSHAGISVQTGEGKREGRARLFPIPGGILRSMDADSPDYSYIAIDGIDRCVAALEEIIAGNLKNCFIEMSACTGSCVGGPAMRKRGMASCIAAVDAYAGKENFHVKTLDEDAFKKEHPLLKLHKTRWGETAVERVLKKMGKTSKAHELNCGSCGYDTCRDKAAAVLAGKAVVDMCLPYLMEKAQSFSENIFHNTPNGTIVVNEQMEIQQINKAACKLLNTASAQDILGRQLVCVLDPTPFLDVLYSDRSLREKAIYLAEYNRYITLTIVRDYTSSLLIGIIRDVTEEEQARNRREELSRKTIQITDQVIEKQMRAVQEIASLLGETTAETKVALTKLKESLGNE